MEYKIICLSDGRNQSCSDKMDFERQEGVEEETEEEICVWIDKSLGGFHIFERYFLELIQCTIEGFNQGLVLTGLV